MLPLINSLIGKDILPIKVLYITPLSALNRDMMKRLEDLVQRMSGITVGVRHGDTSQKENNRQTKISPMLLITTPETLQSILPTKYMGLFEKPEGSCCG